MPIPQKDRVLAPRECRVMVIEDDAGLRRILCDLLAKEGYPVSELPDGTEALRAIREQRPQVVICDFKLPGMSGDEICRQLKSDSSTADIFFLAISEATGAEVEKKLYEAGIDEHLEKPVSPTALLLRMRAARRIVYRARRLEIAQQEMFTNMDVLLVQDGGCAPGYNPVTAFLTADFEKSGHKVFAAAEGFKSLVGGADTDFYRLIYNQSEYSEWESIPHVFNAVFLNRAPGAQFRCERFREFAEEQYQDRAVENILRRKVRILVAIGGNGTFMGACALAGKLPASVQVAFIPVTIDSDVSGTETLGQHTAVEIGATKVSGYIADARTHKRVYVVEMMGARGGYHALYSCLGARAHMVVLPGMQVDHHRVMEALNARNDAVIVVAEGYDRDNPARRESGLNAADWFVKQLQATGIESNKRLITEPFSREIRGAEPNNNDMALAQRMSAGTARCIAEGRSKFMYAVNAAAESVLSFEEIDTDNTVNMEMARLANRLS